MGNGDLLRSRVGLAILGRPRFPGPGSGPAPVPVPEDPNPIPDHLRPETRRCVLVLRSSCPPALVSSHSPPLPTCQLVNLPASGGLANWPTDKPVNSCVSFTFALLHLCTGASLRFAPLHRLYLRPRALRSSCPLACLPCPRVNLSTCQLVVVLPTGPLVNRPTTLAATSGRSCFAAVHHASMPPCI
jgi:hypothetical protein